MRFRGQQSDQEAAKERKSQRRDLRSREYHDHNSGLIIDRRYHLGRMIGEGGMGRVYLATDLNSNQEVVVKIRKRGRPKASCPKRITREVTALRRINHRNIVSVKGAGITNGDSYIVLEYMRGFDLNNYLHINGFLDWGTARFISMQVCSGLGALHSNGIIHLDIKPANIFLMHDGTVKLLDFDLARFDLGDTEEMGVIKGTLAFMSPEQARSQIEDERSDIFSFGATMYAMLTGESPFKREGFWGTAMSVVKEDPAPPSIRNPAGDMPAQVDVIVMKAIEKDPARRFQSVVEFHDAIRAVYSDVAAIPKILSQSISGLLKTSQASFWTVDQEANTMDLAGRTV
jgi:serine/threonine-protein kinase